MKNCFFILIVLLISCTRNKVIDTHIAERDTTQSKPITVNQVITEPEIDLDSIRQEILKDNLRLKHSDTLVYEFSLEGEYSTLGSGGFAYYHDKQLVKMEIVFYGETGKAIYNYVMNDNKWQVERIDYDYKVPLFEVKSDKDMVIREQINFQSDLEGNVIGKSSEESNSDYYLEIKRVVPFDL